MKTLDENDPRLTAYALDELDAGERETVEKFLAENPAARSAVEETRETVALLRKEFEGEPALALGREQRAAVLGNEVPTDAKDKIVRPSGFSRVSRFLGIAAVAACLAAVSVVGLRHYLDEAVQPSVGVAEESVTVTLEPATEGAQLSAGMEAEGKEAESLVDVPLKDAATRDSKESGSRALSLDEIAPNAPTPDPVMTASASRSRAGGGLESEPTELAKDDRRGVEEKAKENLAARSDSERGSSRMDSAKPKSAPAEPDSALMKKEAAGALAEMPARPEVDATPMEEAAASGLAPSGGDGFGSGGAAPASESAGGYAPEPKRRMALPSAPADSFGAGEAKDAAPSPASRMGFSRDKNRAAVGEQYAPLIDNPFVATWDENVSTFSIDVDNAAYSNIRRFVTRNHQLPPKDAVRIEEMINYFDYDYPQPADDHPFSVNLEVASCPWEKDARLVRIGLKGLEMNPGKRPPSNLVFLIDVSGSMAGDDKLPLLQSAMMALVDALNEDDSIAIVVYAGSSGLVLDSTSGDLKGKIKDALAKLQSGGSTNGGQGIELAYATAKQHFIEGGVNRVVLATDGDFNVGVTNHDTLVGMVEEKAKNDHVFLTVLGFGQGNLNDRLMEQIADKGNGNYFYIDNGKEGQRVLVDRLSATLVTIAKDVKIQVDFNPAKVARYRLIGYANRMLENKDFRDDTKDAGEIGAGHTVTALYQILPVGTGTAVAEAKAKVDENASKYLRGGTAADADTARAKELVPSDELLTVRLRYKKPEAEESREFEVGMQDPGTRWEEASGDYRFAASVAGYGMLLRDSEDKGLLNYDLVLELADEGKGNDPHGLRAEFIAIVKASKALSGERE